MTALLRDLRHFTADDVEVSKPRIRVISLGAGVQSTTLALMAAHGEIGPMPDCAITADTKDEGNKFYEHLQWLQSGNTLPFPIHVVSAGNLSQRLDDALEHKASNVIPFYTAGPDGRGRLNRGCTRDYKIYPVRRKIRALFAERFDRAPRAGEVELWIGITTDEVIRATPSTVAYIENRFPFLGLPPHDDERVRKSRSACEVWLQRNEYPVPPRSRCKKCPLTGDEEWARIQREEPDEFAEAVRYDRRLREHGFKGVRQPAYLHDSLKPLDQVDFSKGRGQGFLHECKGMCGV